VRRVFKRLKEEIPQSLAGLDQDVANLVEAYLGTRQVKFRRSDEPARVTFEVEPGAELPAEVGDSRRFATGDARGLADAESLNLIHPLMRAAIGQARGWSGGGYVSLRLPQNSFHDLAELAGKKGVICVALVDYAGFEPVQRLVAGAVADGVPIDPLLAGKVMYLAADDASAFNYSVDPQLLDDAIDEAVFVDQRLVEQDEQRHFEEAIRQLERFVEDKILVCRRERTNVVEKLRAARSRRDEIVGASVRERVEEEILRLATREESLERRIEALESRDDDDYRKWRDAYHGLRYRVPTVTRLFQTTFRIVAWNPEKSC
jgi:hypothetical protein